MKKTPHRHAAFLAILLALTGLNAGAATAPDAAAAAPVPSSELVQRGKYLATAGDCVACHTAPGGKPMAGGLAIPTPLGDIIATNITPSKTHGIGNYTEAQFRDALRKGLRADGQHLYPAMPYTSYAQVSDDDANAMYAYFMQGVAPVDAEPPKETALPFPFNVRLSMAAWNLLFLDSKPFAADASKSAEWNRGAYLTRGLTHCSTCHTPRNSLMAEDIKRELGGAHSGPEVKMQGFRNLMSDVQLATLASYLTKQYGNPDVKVSAEQVRTLRAGGAPSHLAFLAQVGIGAGVLIIIVLLVGLRRRKPQQGE